MEVAYGTGEPQEARLFPSPPVLDLHGGFWLGPFPGQRAGVTAEAFDAEGMRLGRIKAPRTPLAMPGQPDPQPDTDCPRAA